MDLSETSRENIEFMIGEIKTRLNVITDASIKPEHFSEKQYDDIKEIYEHIAGRQTFSISEITAILDELKSIKDK